MKNELIAYLKNVQQLEGDIYAYECSEEELQREIVRVKNEGEWTKRNLQAAKPKLERAPTPVKKQAYVASPPSIGESFETVGTSPVFWTIYVILAIIGSIIFAIGNGLEEEFGVGFAIFQCIIFVISLIVVFFLPVWFIVTISAHIVWMAEAHSRTAQNKADADAEYRHALNEVPRKNAEFLQKYELEMRDYRRQLEKIELDCQNQVHKLEGTITDIQAKKKDLRATLNKAYATGIIYPKYHSLIPISMFLEYFESGRCETLKGHEGAYNIYEMELRQNIIISKLDGISRQIESVKDRQYMLYTAIKDANRISGEMAQYAIEAAKESRAAAENTALSAHYTKSIADSTRLLAQVESERLEVLKRYTEN